MVSERTTLRDTHHARLTTPSVNASNASLASLAGSTSSTSLAFSAYACARSRVREMPDEAWINDMAWGNVVGKGTQRRSEAHPFDIPIVLEFTGDQGLQLGIFFGGVEHWTGRNAQTKICP
jgi:hypothetical protein